MRTLFAGILGLSSFLCAAQTQEPMPPQPQRADIQPRPGHPRPAQDGGNREVLESIVIPPIPNAPFFATLATESVKYSADGASMTFVNERPINYADDLVICCHARADEALVMMRNMMSRLKLTVNENKTRVCRLPEEKFDFLGYTFGRCYSPKTGRAYWGTTPSKKRVQRLCKTISEMTRRSQTQQDAETLVGALNRKINGWANYFCLGPVSPAYRAVEQHTCRRFRQWLCVKHKEQGRGSTRFPQKALHQKFGLVRLTARTASFPWVTA